MKSDSWISDLGKVPILWLNDENDKSFKSYRLVMYKAHHSIVCMFVKSKYQYMIILYAIKNSFLILIIYFSGKSTYGRFV